MTTDSGFAASVRASDAVQPNRSIEHKGKVLKLFGAQILSVHHHLQCIDPDNLRQRRARKGQAAIAVAAQEARLDRAAGAIDRPIGWPPSTAAAGG